MSECERFPEGTRQRAICEGMADLSLTKINRYRERWGLLPLVKKPEGADEVVPRQVLERPAINPQRPLAAVERPPRKLLGDRVEDVLGAVGITEARVTKWLGRPCGCSGRKRKLNFWHTWVESKARGLFKSDQEAKDALEELLE